MSELREWPLSLAVAAVAFLCTVAAIPIGIGCLFGTGYGWLTFAVEMAVIAKQTNDIYMADRRKQREDE